MWTDVIDGLCQIIREQAALNQSLAHALAQHESVEGHEAALDELERRKAALLGITEKGNRA